MRQKLIRDLCAKSSSEIYAPKLHQRFMRQKFIRDLCAKSSSEIYAPKVHQRFMRQKFIDSGLSALSTMVAQLTHAPLGKFKKFTF
jgi:hypothetical protein